MVRTSEQSLPIQTFLSPSPQGIYSTLPRPLKDEAISSRLSSSFIQRHGHISFELDENDDLAFASAGCWQLNNTKKHVFNHKP